MPETPLSGLADRYSVEGELGEGGMAIVYRAIDRKHDRPVAVKVMRPEIAAAMGRERFLSEISIAAKLQHPHILSLIDSGDIDGTLFYVMPYLEGETLAQKIAREKQLAVNDAMQIATEIVSALRYAHQHGVLHRDIKPANIMLTGGHAVVMDFGIARALDKAASRITGTGMMVGTPAYMGPEHFEGNVDMRSDIYAVGCVLYESLAGTPPYTGPTAQSILLKHLGGEVPSLRDVRRDVPRHVDLLVRRALAKKPDDRFPDMATFHAELKLAASGASSMPPEVVATPSEPRTPTNVDAYDTYLRGIHSFEKRTEQANNRAIELLERATREDPRFAPAFAALGAAYVEKFFTYDPNEEWEERAFVAIEKARAIDPNLAKVYVVKGSILWTRARRWPHFEAIDEFRKALALDPNSIEAMNELGKVLWHIGQIDEAIEHLEKTVELDSAFTNGRFRLGMAEMCRGNYERALELFRMLPVGSHGSSVVALTALNLHYVGKTDEGWRVLTRATKEERADSDYAAIEGIFHAMAGRHDDAERSISIAIELGHDLGHFHHAMCYIAAARVLMGEITSGIELLRRGAEDGFPCYPWFEIDPCLVAVRDNLRFTKLMADLRSRWGTGRASW